MEEVGLVKTKDGKTLPLQSVSIHADIKGYVLGLRATMKYSNEDSDPVEVLFKLPLESTQAVVGLTACIDGRRIRADVQEKEQAKANYDDAIASGQTAAYGETKTEDVFSIALGNLPGGKEAEIELQMVQELPVDAEGKVRFSLPATFKPRYTPQGSTDPLAPLPDSVGETPIERGKIRGFKQFLLCVHKSDSIASVTSPTHTIKVAPGTKEDVLDVTIDEESVTDKNLTTDLVIQIETKAPHQPTVLVENGRGNPDKDASSKFLDHPAIMVNFFPEVPEVDASCELIFLVDRSGSMSGGFIKSASETLVLFLKSMPEGSYFNIYGFGSRFESLFPKSVLYDQTTLATATAHAQGLKADLGGTEILPPLRAIFGQPEIKGITRQIFLLTDGAVSNTSSCVTEVKTNAHKARCFTFGIGSGASTELVNGIAKAGNGTAEFVKFGERLQPKVIRSLKHALQPAVTDVKVEFTGIPANINVLVSPKNLPPLFSGEKTVIYGVLESKDGKPLDESFTGNVKLSGTLLGRQISHELLFEATPIDHTPHEEGVLPIHRLAAKRLLEEMQTGNQSAKDIVKLSVESHVISKETAFIAVDEDSTEPVTGAMKTYDIEPELEDISYLQQQVASVACAMSMNIDSAVTRGDQLESLSDQSDNLMSSAAMFNTKSRNTRSGGGWLSNIGSSIAGLFKGSNSSSPSYRSSSPIGPAVLRSSVPDEMMNDCYGCDSLASEDDEDNIEGVLKELIEEDEYMEMSSNMPVIPKPSSNRSSVKNTITSSSSDTIILLQQANGSWLLDQPFSNAVGISLVDVKSSCPKDCDEVVWATVVAVMVLRMRYSSQQDEWDLVVKKANSWLKGKTSEAELKEFNECAEKLINIA